MSFRRAFLDANLLVLLVVGSVDRNLIGSHRRVRQFTLEHYDSLLGLLKTLQCVSVTPNTLTEASNLLENPQDTRFLDELRNLIDNSEETVIDSRDAVRRGVFTRIGLTDAALLEVVSAANPLVTTDYDLWGLAVRRGESVAFNFWHRQSWS